MGGQSALLGSAVFQVPWLKIDNFYAQVIYFQVEYSATFQCQSVISKCHTNFNRKYFKPHFYLLYLLTSFASEAL